MKTPEEIVREFAAQVKRRVNGYLTIPEEADLAVLLESYAEEVRQDEREACLGAANAGYHDCPGQPPPDGCARFCAWCAGVRFCAERIRARSAKKEGE